MAAAAPPRDTGKYNLNRSSNAFLGVWIARHTHRFPLPFPGPGVGRSPLAANRKPPSVPVTTVAINRGDPLHVPLDFPAKIPLDRDATILDRMSNLAQLVIRKLTGPNIGIDARFFQDLLSRRPADPVNIRKRCFDSLLVGNFNCE